MARSSASESSLTATKRDLEVPPLLCSTLSYDTAYSGSPSKKSRATYSAQSMRGLRAQLPAVSVDQRRYFVNTLAREGSSGFGGSASARNA